jgi:hypothetical protein
MCELKAVATPFNLAELPSVEELFQTLECITQNNVRKILNVGIDNYDGRTERKTETRRD